MQRFIPLSLSLACVVSSSLAARPTPAQAKETAIIRTLDELQAPRGAGRPDGIQRSQVNGGLILPGFDDDGDPLVFENTRVAANGGSLRNAASTGIDLIGVPPGSTVVRAYLYWAWASLGAPVPGLHDTMVIARVPRQGKIVPAPGALLVSLRPRCVTGTLVGAGGDPCWFGGSNFVYRADVTAIVRRGDTYLVWVPTGAAGATDYSDPWSFPGPALPLCEGASLVAVYTHPVEPPGTTYIYDAGLSGAMFFSDPGFAYGLGGFFYPGVEARWIDVGADGQTGAGYLDFFALAQETTTFAGAPIAGPGSVYSDSDWNGSGNKPLGQLWDTSGHDATPFLAAGAGAVPITVASPAGAGFDCLVPVCNVLWLR